MGVKHTNNIESPSSKGVIGSEASLVFKIGDKTNVISTGASTPFEVPFNCNVVGWTIFSNETGSIVIDVWKDTYANSPPTVADTIAGTEKPTLSSAAKNQDLTLSTWTVGLTKGDVIILNVDSATTVKEVVLILRVVKT